MENGFQFKLFYTDISIKMVLSTFLYQLWAILEWGIIVDYEKAFDSLKHEFLTNSIHSQRVQKRLVQLIKEITLA